jgi:hypothetical protein
MREIERGGIERVSREGERVRGVERGGEREREVNREIEGGG